MSGKGFFGAKDRFTRSHGQVLRRFAGAVNAPHKRYNEGEVLRRAFPFLAHVKSKGCFSFVDSIPAYSGRDVVLHW